MAFVDLGVTLTGVHRSNSSIVGVPAANSLYATNHNRGGSLWIRRCSAKPLPQIPGRTQEIHASKRGLVQILHLPPLHIRMPTLREPCRRCGANRMRIEQIRLVLLGIRPGKSRRDGIWHKSLVCQQVWGGQVGGEVDHDSRCILGYLAPRALGTLFIAC